jgi:uncharacterized membrane protein
MYKPPVPIPNNVLSIGAPRHALNAITWKPRLASAMPVTRSLQELPTAKTVKPRISSLTLSIIAVAFKTATTSLAMTEIQAMPKQKPRKLKTTLYIGATSVLVVATKVALHTSEEEIDIAETNRKA